MIRGLQPFIKIRTALFALADQTPTQHTHVEGLGPLEVGHMNGDLGVGRESGLWTLQELRQLPQFSRPPALVLVITRLRTKARLA